MRNKKYQSNKKQCPICGRCVDCNAKVKPYVEIAGKPVHVKCVDAKKSELFLVWLAENTF